MTLDFHFSLCSLDNFCRYSEVNAMTASVLPWYALCTLFEGPL